MKNEPHVTFFQHDCVMHEDTHAHHRASITRAFVVKFKKMTDRFAR